MLCAIPLVSWLFASCEPPMPFATGYVEGNYVQIASVATAQILALSVTSGDRVASGQPLVELEKRDAEIALAQAEAALSRAESQLANLRQRSLLVAKWRVLWVAALFAVWVVAQLGAFLLVGLPTISGRSVSGIWPRAGSRPKPSVTTQRPPRRWPKPG